MIEEKKISKKISKNKKFQQTKNLSDLNNSKTIIKILKN